jgi:hypothetical protein
MEDALSDQEFVAARMPANEVRRLSEVRRTGLMGTDNKARFDIYTRLFRHVAGVPVAYSGLIDEARQYFLSENFTGCLTGVSEVAREETLCQHALLDTKPYIVPDLRENDVFRHHPLVAGDPHWVFWAGFPLVTQEGYVLGSICAVDFTPKYLSPEQVDLLLGIAADMALTIQLQADQQEILAAKCDGVLDALSKAGVTDLLTARAFLRLCVGGHVDKSGRAAVLQAGLAEEDGPELGLSAKGNTLRTGQGIGPAAYKAKASPIRDADLLDAMFDMMDEAET